MDVTIFCYFPLQDYGLDNILLLPFTRLWTLQYFVASLCETMDVTIFCCFPLQDYGHYNILLLPFARLWTLQYFVASLLQDYGHLQYFVASLYKTMDVTIFCYFPL